MAHAYDLIGFKRSIRSLGAASVAAVVAEDRVRELKREDGGKVQKKRKADAKSAFRNESR